jgi:hypothetical protein
MKKYLIACMVGMVCVSAFAQPTTRPAGTRPSTRPASTQPRVTQKFTAEHPNGKETIVCTIDITESPESREWALKAGPYALKWYPKLEETLASEGYTPTREFIILFQPRDGAPAFASGNVINVSANWIKRRPDDFGMVAHELVHVIQRYRGVPRDSGWLTEGIADYVRYYIVEPDSRQKGFNPERQSYKNGYQPSAAFLNWIEKDKPGTVSKINAALRQRKYNLEMFKELTGGTPDEMWEKFKETLKKPQ